MCYYVFLDTHNLCIIFILYIYKAILYNSKSTTGMYHVCMHVQVHMSGMTFLD